MKHTFVKNKEAEVLECEVCGYVWGQEEKRGCGEREEQERKKEHKEIIIKAYKKGEIKILNNRSYSVPSEFFVLGITPRIVNNVLKELKGGLEKWKNFI